MDKSSISTRSKSKLAEEESELTTKEKEQTLHEVLREHRDKFDREKRQLEQLAASLREREAEISRREALHNRLQSPSAEESMHKTTGVGQGPSPFQDTTAYPPFVNEFAIDSPRISFRDALEAVPHFDGKNISLTQFTRACRRARDCMPPSAERNLTHLILNKLRGRASFAVEGEPCDSITQLLDILESTFGSVKTIDQCRGELSTIFMRPYEEMLDYIMRVKELQSAVLDRERREHGTLDEKTVRNVNELTARSFCEGLPRDYRYWLRNEHYFNPHEAFAFAKALAKRREIDDERDKNARRQEYRTPRSDVNLVDRPIAHSTPMRPPQREYQNPRREYQTPRRDYTSPRVPFFNHIRGPRAYESPPQNRWSPQPRRFSETPRYQDVPRNRDVKWCRYCKNNGHEIDECRKRQFNNQPRNQGNDRRPSGNRDEPRAGPSRTPNRPIRAIETEESEPTLETPESQS